MFYTFTDQLVECHHLRELEKNYDRRFLLSRMVSEPETETASLVTKIPFYKDGTIMQMLHLVFIEQRDNSWSLCVEEPETSEYGVLRYNYDLGCDEFWVCLAEAQGEDPGGDA